MSDGEKKERIKRSHQEARAAKIDEYSEKIQVKKAVKSLKKRKEQLKKATDKFKRRREKDRSNPVAPNKLKNYDAEVAFQEREMSKDVAVGVSMKITPDLEKIMFPYFVSGASVRSIHTQFGRQHNFGLQALYSARDIYKWEQRRNAILKVVRGDSDLQMAERFKDYQAFFDDLLSEAIIRFQKNSEMGANSNPFNTLKVTNIKDMKDLVEMLLNLRNSGIKKFEIENKSTIKMSNKKQMALLEALAMDDEEGE